MKKLIIILVILFSVIGCSNQPIDISGIDQNQKSPEEIKEGGNPFTIFEYDGKNIPIMADVLPMNEKYYVIKHSNRSETDHAELFPTSFIAVGSVISTLYRDDGDPEKHEDLAVYVDASIDGNDLDVKFEGYLKNSGKLFIEGWTKAEYFLNDKDADKYHREQLQTAYNLVRDIAYAQKGWSSTDGHHWQRFDESFIIDANSTELIEKNVFNDYTDIYSYDNDLGMPEYRFEVSKDKKEIINDLSNMHCLAQYEHFEEEDYLISEYFNEELLRFYDLPYMDSSLSIYVYPELAYLRDYELTTHEDSEGHTFEGTFEKDAEKYFFDGDWRLTKYENGEIRTEYTYEDSQINIELTDLVSGNKEIIKYTED